MKRMHYFALLITLVFLMLGVVIAHPEPSADTATQPEDPILMLEKVTGNVLQALKTRKTQDLKGIYSLVDNYILPYVDFNEMSQWVAGKTIWNKASAQTQREFMEAFKILVVRTYATALNNYSDEKVEFTKQKLDLKKERIQVSSTIVRKGTKNEDIKVDYRLIKKGDKWYVYDIIIEGISILQGFQAQFSNDIRQKGLQQVIAQIQKHNREANV